MAISQADIWMVGNLEILSYKEKWRPWGVLSQENTWYQGWEYLANGTLVPGMGCVLVSKVYHEDDNDSNNKTRTTDEG